ncbi:hypothetical protein [Methylobacterium isbiliense]|jgi:hypothetical protein|uniref:Uncharacterized protein n=1 Tax=Methylobacterium isbiliense TaxID=315478 RepID=A0ABQ4SDP3_9HYPH|nr:hypothetical protein [Methylobacterium isbiliense]MDN3623760.1 hypothetical protein [Methylobacterium isbiliense]GJE01177.1 hypothetical protein GMJLKIPL_3106 [Methylobacterium isbiliense]
MPDPTIRDLDEAARNLIRLGLLHDVEGRVAVADGIRARTKDPVEGSTDIIRRRRDAV